MLCSLNPIQTGGGILRHPDLNPLLDNSTLRTLHSETKMIIKSFYHFFTQVTEELKLGY